MRLADIVGRNRGAFNSLRVCLVYLTIAICLIKDIISAYRLSLRTLKLSLARELSRTAQGTWPDQDEAYLTLVLQIGTSLALMDFTIFSIQDFLPVEMCGKRTTSCVLYSDLQLHSGL